MGLLDWEDDSLKRAINRRKIEASANLLLKNTKKKRRGKKKKLIRPSLKGIPTMSYKAYIKSGYWRKRKKKFFKKYGKYCAICHSSKMIHLHHKSYKYKFGAEPDIALVALCGFHHNEFHKSYPLQKNMEKNTNKFIKEATLIHKQLKDSNIDDLSWI